MSITRRFNSDRLATWMVIVLCSVATLWLGQDMVAGGDSGPGIARPSPGGGQPNNRAARPAPPLPSQPISIADAMTKGSDQAKVVLIAFSDFECPYCSRFAKDTLPALEEKYIKTGRVRLAFRHMPIESIHPAAFKAAEATECAGQQGRFWQMHDRLFDEFKQLSQPQLLGHAKSLALNLMAFETCLKGAATAKVRADAAFAAQLGVTGTPAFFVGQVQSDGRVKVTDRIVGARPTAAFEAALDRALGHPKP